MGPFSPSSPGCPSAGRPGLAVAFPVRHRLSLMANSSKLPPEWYYRRFQAVGLPQSRYLLLSVLVAAYTFGLSFTTRTTVSVSILVCRTSPRRSSTPVG